MQSFLLVRPLALALAIVSPLLVAPFAAAQAPTASQDAVDAALAQPDYFLMELRRRARGNTMQRAQSIRDALRLRLDEQASTFLAALATLELTDAQRAEMADIISGERLLRVMVDEAFTEPAREQANAMLAAKRRYSEDTQRIAAAIAAVGSGDSRQELPAFRTLLAAGTTAIGPLAIAAAGEPDAERRDALLRVLARLGEESLAALAQLALYADDVSRAGALASLDRLRGSAALPYLTVAAHAPTASAAERRIATDLLSARFGKVPTHHEAQTYLLDRLAERRITAGQQGLSDATAHSWLYNAEEKSLTPTLTTAGLAAQRQVADMSRLLQRLGGLSAEALRSGVTADLAYRYQLDPLTVIEQADDLRRLWGEQVLSASSLGAIIHTALAEDDLAAAVAAMSLIGDASDGDPAELMTTHSAVPSPLVQAVRHSVPQVRYEAAAAIARLQFPQSYVGSSTVLKTWIEMTQLSREPVALIVETRGEVGAQVERLITARGYRVEVASSVAEAVEILDRGGDLRMVISTSILPDRPVLELVDAIRRHPFGLRIPIFIYGPEDDSTVAATEQQRWETPVIHVERPASVAGWGMVLEPILTLPLGKLQGLEPLTAVQRFDFRRQAMSAIGHLASHPEIYHFYDFRSVAAASLEVGSIETGEVGNVAFGDPRLAVLSVAASGESQAALVDLLLQTAAAPDRYQAVSEALRHSLARNGILISGAVLRRLDAAVLQTAEGPQRRAIMDVIETISARVGVGSAEGEE